MKGSENPFPSVNMEEIASDGSTLSNADADFRRLFLGEDGALHLKDAAGTVTEIGASIAEITDIPTADTTTTNVLAPDGTGGVEWRAEPGGAADITDIPTTEMDDTLVLAPDGSGGVEFRAEAAGGGPTGIDIPPESPSAYDDEFSALSGWTTLGSLDALNVTDFPGYVHLAKTTSGSRVDGIYKTSPSAPFTITVSLAGALHGFNYQNFSVMIADSTPTALYTFGPTWINTSPFHSSISGWTNNESRGDFTDMDGLWAHPLYIRMIVTSATSVTSQLMTDGFIWHTYVTAANPGFTPAKFGFGMSAFASVPVEAVVNWFRVVTGTPGQTWNGTAWV